MSTLSEQQNALLDIVLGRTPSSAINNAANYIDLSWQRGIKVYLANGHALAAEALRSTYPVLTQLLGDDSQRMLAYDFWHAHPPERGDMAQWGQALASFVQSSEQLSTEPYLPDVIRLEWALHQATTHPDPQPEPASLALLTTHDPLHITLKLARPCVILQSHWPVVSMVLAHQSNASDKALDFVGLAQKLKDGVAETALVWRQGLQPRLRQLIAGEQKWIELLQTRHSLQEALAGAPELDFQSWLPQAYSEELLLGAEPLQSESTQRETS
jgi:hypothetical protein